VSQGQPDSMFLPEYWKAVHGVARGADAEAMAELIEIARRPFTLVLEAKKRIFSFALGKGSPESAYSFVRRTVEMRDGWDDREEYTTLLVLHIALEEAKADTRYWGIEDPSTESWCGYCKKALPVSLFNESEHTYDDCYSKRRRT